MKTLERTSTILLCAATKWEAEPLARALGLARTSESSFGAGPLTLAKIGAGARAAQGLARLAAPELVISVGLCGALQPGILTGDIVFDIQGAQSDWPPLAREAAAAAGTAIHFGRLVDSPRVLATREEKARLGESRRAAAVDMETAEIRRWAESRGAQVFAARAALDALDDEVPSELPRAEDAASMARYALSNLFSLPLLLSTGLRSRRAMSALGLFLSEFLPRI